LRGLLNDALIGETLGSGSQRIQQRECSRQWHYESASDNTTPRGRGWRTGVVISVNDEFHLEVRPVKVNPSQGVSECLGHIYAVNKLQLRCCEDRLLRRDRHGRLL
jgi:hypothetical protein